MPVADIGPLREALDSAYGTLVTVSKRRHLLIWEGVRIHLDEVEGLGNFVELEAVAEPGSDLTAEHEKVERLRAELGVEDANLVATSYSDLLLDTGEGAPAPGADELLAAAEQVMHTAHVKYSHFPVGAALRAGDGQIYVGSNVENASYPQGQCAETSAIGALIAAGQTRITEVAVTAAHMDFCPPCGGCRQRLAEFASRTPRSHGPAGRPPDDEDRGRAAAARVRVRAARMSEGEARGGEAAAVLTERAGLRPRVGVVLGSGLGAVADAVADATVVDYADLPGFPETTVAGHGGRAVLGGIGEVPVAVLQGRAHVYEGGGFDRIRTPVRALRAAGAEILVLTNAAGSLRAEVGPGPADAHHGPHQPERRERPRGAERRRDRPALPEPARRVRPGAARAPPRGGRGARHRARRGRLPGGVRPHLRDAAEIRAFATLGADAVGMSTVHETAVARHCGLRVAAISAISNFAEGMSDQRSATSRRCATPSARPRTWRRCWCGSWRARPSDVRAGPDPRQARRRRAHGGAVGELVDGHRRRQRRDAQAARSPWRRAHGDDLGGAHRAHRRMRDSGDVLDWSGAGLPGRCSTSTRPAASVTR